MVPPTTNSNANPIINLKVLLIGNPSVGKSTLLQGFSDEQGLPDVETGCFCRVHNMEIKGKEVELSIWDTVGQEPSSYYGGAQGVILVYDLANRESFETLQRWYSELETYASSSIIKILVGNKLDKEFSRQVPTSDGHQFANRMNSLFIETSAKTAVNVKDAFLELVQKILETPEMRLSGGTVNGVEVKGGHGGCAALVQQPSLGLSDTTAPSPEVSVLSPPALDPNSSSSLADPVPGEKEHTLLDFRLLDARLKVTVTGGTYNNRELTASIKYIDGRLRIFFRRYTMWNPLDPAWVTPKSPNPTRDNGLLIVVKGNHCGKYVRRIHHRYDGATPILILGVVDRLAGQVDTLTEERLELRPSYLCLCDEPVEDKRRNRSVMDAVRAEARKIRAK